MIEHPQKTQRAELEIKRAELAKQEFDAALAAHEKRIDALLQTHLESQTKAHVDYELSDALPGIDHALAKKYKDGGWNVMHISTFSPIASLNSFVSGAPRQPDPPPRLRFS